MSKKAILCVLDGWGIAPPSSGNAITESNPQTYNYLIQNFPHSNLEAAGPAVGLPPGQDGNSETGHLNIGAGRVVYQDLSIINMAIADGSFFSNKVLLDTIKHLKSFDSRLHLLGMVGESGVHSSTDHLYALLIFAKKQGLKEVFIHLISDGRDSPPDNFINQIAKIKQKISQIGIGEIVSVMGRYYAMDRDNRLERTYKAYNCLVSNNTNFTDDIRKYVLDSYSNKVTDEFILPTAIKFEAKNTRVKAADSVIFFNFRTDRPRQLTEMFLKHPLANQRFVTMTQYQEDFNTPFLFKSQKISNTLGETISSLGLSQLRVAETEKIAMVTYFFNGQLESAFPNEERFFVDSPKVSTYDLAPAMSTQNLIDIFREKFLSKDYTLGVLNIACPDMVAHTGKIEETKLAISAADKAMLDLVKLAQETSSYLIITADHGNAEELINLSTGKVDTEHSTSPVPLIIYHPTDNHFKIQNGKLGDIAPTILNLLNIEPPAEISGTNLIQK